MLKTIVSCLYRPSNLISKVNVEVLDVVSFLRFYPFHYAPFMSDIRNFSEVELEFELGTPFLPFEQLLAVLPAASRQLLPKPFQVRFVILLRHNYYLREVHQL